MTPTVDLAARRASWPGRALALLVLLAVARGADGQGAAEPAFRSSARIGAAVDATGAWSGTWQSRRGLMGSVTLALGQSGSSVQGSIRLTGSPALTVGRVTGTVSGDTLTFSALFGAVAADFVGIVSGNRVTGTFTAMAIDDAGTWSAAQAPPAPELLTNEAVLEMVQAGLSEGVIIAKIRSTPRGFDTSPQALIALKRAGVSDAVLEAMLAPEPRPVLEPLPPLPPPPRPAVAARTPYSPVGLQVIEHLRPEGTRVSLRNAEGRLEYTYAFFVSKTEIVIPRRQTEYRIADRQPVFRTDYPRPELLRLARLRPGGKDDRNLTVRSQTAFEFGTRLGYEIAADDLVTLVIERDPQGGARIRPAQPLPPGEYGFLVMAAARLGYFTVSEFGID